MQAMTLHDWSNLSVSERQAWLESQSPRRLTELLVMVGEMLLQADDMDGQMSILIEPSEDVTNARNFTYNMLRDFEHHLAVAIQNRHEQIFERTV